MPMVTLDLPADVLSALRTSPEEFAREMRLAAAIFWYGQGRISQGKAAQVAGLTRTDFLRAVSQAKVDVIHVDLDEVREAVTHD